MDITLDQLVKTYDGKVILDNLSINIENQGAIALIGPSGSGKSTLLRQLSMLEIFDSGKVLINKNPLIPEYKRDYHKRVGFVFQNHNLFPHLTLERNITLILEKTFNIKKDEAKKIARNKLCEFGLKDHIDKKPDSISGGQAQRASIARALSSSPEIVYLDEPTASLDPLLTHSVLDAILELKKLNKDFVIVTHEINFVRKVADYYIYMEDGKIEDHGPMWSLDKSSNKNLKEFLNKVL